MSAPVEKKGKIPDAPTPQVVPSGNLLSSVAPPSMLPNFVTTAPKEESPKPAQSASPLNKPETNVGTTSSISSSQGAYVPTVFSAAIPPSKGEPTAAVRSPETLQPVESSSSVADLAQDVRQIGDPMPGSGLLTWMKGAVSGGGILQKVAEKAKSSVDTMITTLDPQMKEYLNSGGDIEILVASDKDDKVSPVREAFQSVFGKATVFGVPAQSKVTATQPVGQAAALSAAKERIAQIRSNNQNVNNNVPIIAIESFVVEQLNDRWFDIAALVLTQPSLNIDLLVFSQATPVPSAVIAALKADTPANYELRETGFCNTVGAYMAANLKVQHNHWHEASTTVARREMLLLAAKSLAGSYQKLLTISSTEMST